MFMSTIAIALVFSLYGTKKEIINEVFTSTLMKRIFVLFIPKGKKELFSQVFTSVSTSGLAHSLRGIC